MTDKCNVGASFSSRPEGWSFHEQSLRVYKRLTTLMVGVDVEEDCRITPVSANEVVFGLKNLYSVVMPWVSTV